MTHCRGAGALVGEREGADAGASVGDTAGAPMGALAGEGGYTLDGRAGGPVWFCGNQVSVIHYFRREAP